LQKQGDGGGLDAGNVCQGVALASRRACERAGVALHGRPEPLL